MRKYLTTKIRCFHCMKKRKGETSLCRSCQKWQRCEICNIMFCKLKRHVAVQSKNPNRCESCGNYEEKIKEKCFICGNHIENSPKYYKNYGNCCWICNAKSSTRGKER